MNSQEDQEVIHLQVGNIMQESRQHLEDQMVVLVPMVMVLQPDFSAKVKEERVVTETVSMVPQIVDPMIIMVALVDPTMVLEDMEVELVVPMVLEIMEVESIALEAVVGMVMEVLVVVVVVVGVDMVVEVVMGVEMAVQEAVEDMEMVV
ncbi:unnamed protein product [Aphis gossypii]|uniref:Uncharacterized protein n=1 Tax=Aphis gossypii TaxID=80765 RepID=A0A9P0J8Z3_APHGO|nr:unnamed protein product [Aphis gossypii]